MIGFPIILLVLCVALVGWVVKRAVNRTQGHGYDGGSDFVVAGIWDHTGGHHHHHDAGCDHGGGEWGGVGGGGGD
jgi:hypothetical protein